MNRVRFKMNFSTTGGETVRKDTFFFPG